MERRQEILKRMNLYEIPFEFFDAIEGQLLDDSVMNKIHSKGNLFRKMYGRDMEKGEAGAAMSHLSVYRKIIEDDISAAIVLEDDVDFDSLFKFFLFNTNDIESVFKPYELILMGYSEMFHHHVSGQTSFWHRKKIGKGLYIGKPINWCWGAYAYIITKKGAEKIMSQEDVPIMQADFLTANSPYYGIKMGILSKPIVWPGKLNKISTIRDRQGNPDIDIRSQSVPQAMQQPENFLYILYKFAGKLKTSLAKKIKPIKLFVKKVSLNDYQFIVNLKAYDQNNT